MATQFAFPASPTVGQIASLPDGNQAQWNGYAWVEVGGSGITTYFADTAPPNPKYGDRWIRPASATEVVWVPNANNAGVWLDLVDAGAPVYPLAVSLGGTGATTASAARFNLGLDTATGERIIPVDGTVAKPAIAFLSESGLGFYRPSVSNIGVASGGLAVLFFDTGNASMANLGIRPRAAGSSSFILRNQPTGVADYNQLTISQAVGGGATLGTSVAGTATRGNLTLDAPQVITTGGISTTAITTGNGGVFCGNGMAFLWDGGNARRMAFQGSGGSWCWQWDAPSGDIVWQNGSAQALIVFDHLGGAAKLGAGTAWANVSDARAKTNIRDYTEGLEQVLSLRPVLYDRIDTEDRDAVGCIADEAEVGFPKLIERKPGKIGEVEYADRAELHIDPLFWAMVNSIKTIDARLKAAGL